jgi:hypothetical protein
MDPDLGGPKTYRSKFATLVFSTSIMSEFIVTRTGRRKVASDPFVPFSKPFYDFGVLKYTNEDTLAVLLKFFCQNRA